MCCASNKCVDCFMDTAFVIRDWCFAEHLGRCVADAPVFVIIVIITALCGGEATITLLPFVCRLLFAAVERERIFIIRACTALVTAGLLL